MKKRSHLIKNKGFGLTKIKGLYGNLFNTSFNSNLGSGIAKTKDTVKRSALSDQEFLKVLEEANRKAWEITSPDPGFENPFGLLMPFMRSRFKVRNLSDSAERANDSMQGRVKIRSVWDHQEDPGIENRRAVLKGIEKLPPKPYREVSEPTATEMLRNLQDLPFDTSLRIARFSKEFIKACLKTNPNGPILVTITSGIASIVIKTAQIASKVAINLPTYLVSLSTVPLIQFSVPSTVPLIATVVNPISGAITFGLVFKGIVVLFLTDAVGTALSAMTATPTWLR